mgnify:CR=1 FL=1
MDSGDARKPPPSAQDAIRRKAVKAVVEGGMSQTMAAEVFGASRPQCVCGARPTGFPEAIRAVYPQAEIQRCLIHQVRNSLA